MWEYDDAVWDMDAEFGESCADCEDDEHCGECACCAPGLTRRPGPTPPPGAIRRAWRRLFRTDILT